MHVRRRLHPADDPEAGNPSDAADEEGAEDREDGIVIAPERSDTPS
jgi:hypothetical protein